jgi:uncharacterized membrane protein YbhN (UPF0104 family)
MTPRHSYLLPGLARPGRKALRRIVVLAAFALVVGLAVATVSGAAGIGARLAQGRPEWLVAAVGLELISALGFIATFHLVFGEWLSGWMSLRVGLAVRAATIVLPAGGLVAIGVGARVLRRRGMPRAKAGCRAIAFLLITNAPNVIVLAILGLALGAGLLNGPHALAVTVLPGAIAAGAIGLTLLLPVLSHQRVARQSPRIWRRVISWLTTQLELGVIEARTLLRGRDWKLLGVFAYYAADNAVLWATFKAFGHARPPIATLVMAYLIGSAAGSLPVPAGIGVVDGGMIGLLVLYGAPAICAGIAVLAYRAVSTGLPLALGGGALLTLRRRAPRRPLAAPRRTLPGTPPLEV